MIILRKKLTTKRSGRAEYKKDAQMIPERERALIFTDLPFEV
jgi:hypothetical protein